MKAYDYYIAVIKISKEKSKKGIGDYLLLRIVWSPNWHTVQSKDHNDFYWGILKDFEENYGSDSCVENTVQPGYGISVL